MTTAIRLSSFPRKRESSVLRRMPLGPTVAGTTRRFASVSAMTHEGDTLRASERRRGLARQMREQPCQFVLELTAVDDHIDRAFLDQKLGALKTLG